MGEFWLYPYYAPLRPLPWVPRYAPVYVTFQNPYNHYWMHMWLAKYCKKKKQFLKNNLESFNDICHYRILDFMLSMDGTKNLVDGETQSVWQTNFRQQLKIFSEMMFKVLEGNSSKWLVCRELWFISCFCQRNEILA